MGRSINLNEIETKQALKIMMAESNVESFSELARRLDIPQTTFRSAINNESIRLSLFLKVAESLGYTVVIEPKQ